LKTFALQGKIQHQVQDTTSTCIILYVLNPVFEKIMVQLMNSQNKDWTLVMVSSLDFDLFFLKTLFCSMKIRV